MNPNEPTTAPQKSDTPRTDAFYFQEGGVSAYDMAGLCKELERELAASEKHLEIAINQGKESDAKAESLLAIDRRERIATACLAGVLACFKDYQASHENPRGRARVALSHADALIELLDKK